MVSENTPLILIVEDDTNLSEMLAAYLHVQGFSSMAVAWGEEAVSRARQSHPDLIILDIHLPDINGYEVCQRLRQSHKTRAIPILFLTEMSSQADKRHGLEMGVVDYITKPFDVQELSLRVRNILRRAASTGVENPVTGLPEGQAVEEALAHITSGAWPDHAVLVVAMHGLDSFRELYGFVASDDVLRVTSLTLNRATLEAGGGDSFTGHLDDHTFVIILPADRLHGLERRIEERLANALDYFYPGDNRGPNAFTTDRLRLWWASIPTGEVAGSLDELRQQLAALPTAMLSP
jgi:PleD family two-component response regulator